MKTYKLSSDGMKILKEGIPYIEIKLGQEGCNNSRLSNYKNKHKAELPKNIINDIGVTREIVEYKTFKDGGYFIKTKPYSKDEKDTIKSLLTIIIKHLEEIK